METKNIQHSTQSQTIIEVITALVAATPAFVFQLLSNTCEDEIFRFLAIGLLTVSLAAACALIYHRWRQSNALFLSLICAGALLAYLCLGYLVLTKKCKVDTGSVNISNSFNNNTIVTGQKTVRSLNDADIAELNNRLADKRARILVQYLKSETCDSLLCGQIQRRLVGEGYANTFIAPATSLENNLQPGKLTIIKDILQYKVIINPQQ